MRQLLLDLYELQKLDLDLRELDKNRDAIPERLQLLDTSLRALQDEQASLTEQRDKVAREAQTLRFNVEEEVLKIRKWEARLNEIRNQREYQALSRETEGSRRANRDLEGKIIDLMALQEQLEQQLEALAAKVEAETAKRQEEEARVSTLLQELDGRAARMRSRREALVPRVPKALYRKYDSIRSRRLGVGLAAVSGGCCMSCNIRLPPQQYNILQRGDTLEQCPSCSRIIFWDQILTSTEEAAPAAPAAP